MHLQEGVFMQDSECMPPCCLRSSDINMRGEGCVVATREKTVLLLSTDENHFLHYVLYLMQLSVAHKQSLRCCNLIPRDLLDSFLAVDY